MGVDNDSLSLGAKFLGLGIKIAVAVLILGSLTIGAGIVGLAWFLNS